MTRRDIPFGMRLKEIAGWNQTENDWKRLIDLEPEGCFIAQIDGTDVGTATSISYDDRFGWVAMVLVDPDFRRRGVGTTLLNACIEYLENNVAAVKLDATPMGKKLYDTIGFEDEYQMERWMGKCVAADRPPSLVPITDDLVEAVCAFDEPVFGADRSKVIRRLTKEDETTSFCVMEGDDVGGYGVIRPGSNAFQLGPVVARDAHIADDLFTGLLTASPGDPVICDILLPNSDGLPLLRERGFEKQRYLIRMYRGENRWPGTPSLVYAATGPEKG
jgi:hypothetical protein